MTTPNINTPENAKEFFEDLRKVLSPDNKVPAPYLYPLFEHMSNKHGLTLIDSELDEIALKVDECRKLVNVVLSNSVPCSHNWNQTSRVKMWVSGGDGCGGLMPPPGLPWTVTESCSICGAVRQYEEPDTGTTTP